MVVDDGQVIVLGGLIEGHHHGEQVPGADLGDIPYLGALFRSESREKKRVNQMVFSAPGRDARCGSVE